jgi:hypothetical protein
MNYTTAIVFNPIALAFCFSLDDHEHVAAGIAPIKPSAKISLVKPPNVDRRLKAKGE